MTVTLCRNRDFLRFRFGETLSLLGAQVTDPALPLTAIHAFQATGLTDAEHQRLGRRHRSGYRLLLR